MGKEQMDIDAVDFLGTFVTEKELLDEGDCQQ